MASVIIFGILPTAPLFCLGQFPDRAWEKRVIFLLFFRICVLGQQPRVICIRFSVFSGLLCDWEVCTGLGRLCAVKTPLLLQDLSYSAAAEERQLDTSGLPIGVQRCGVKANRAYYSTCSNSWVYNVTANTAVVDPEDMASKRWIESRLQQVKQEHAQKMREVSQKVIGWFC